jgi:Nucleotidyl transferase AbiEii toxin, Type IV TA system
VNPILAAATEVEAFCSTRGWRFCFIGGIAVQRWGEPRLTQDVDLTLLTGFGGETPYIDALLDRFEGRRIDAGEFARRNRVVLLRSSNGVPVDIALGAMPFEERAVRRASKFDIGTSAAITTCSAEDLIVHKAFAGRGQDWLDIETIVARHGASIDRELIVTEAEPLLELKDAPDDLMRLQAILGR